MNSLAQVSGTDVSAEQIREQIAQAYKEKATLNITSGNSKKFLGVPSNTKALSVAHHNGIISYEPSELVITAKAGTTLVQLNDTLTQQNQMLPFEPPAFGETATIGGTIACGLSGPARPYIGAARDFILGCTIVNGRGEQLRFGGQVMKNVAGYDVTRLMTGAMGTLGVLLDVSMKVLPVAEQEMTLIRPTTVSDAITVMQSLAGKSLPVTASAFHNGHLYCRIAGAPSAVKAAAAQLGGDELTDSTFWHKLKEHKLDFFHQTDMPLWRLSLPALTPDLNLASDTIYDWAGMQRWFFSDKEASTIRQTAMSAGGHAQLYRADLNLQKEVGVFHPPEPAIMTLHKKLKNEFDPAAILNPGRLYAEL